MAGDPGQVLVNVADLRTVLGPFDKQADYYTARDRLAAAMEPEWGPTDDMRAKYRRAYITTSAPSLDWAIDKHLLALHREGLL